MAQFVIRCYKNVLLHYMTDCIHWLDLFVISEHRYVELYFNEMGGRFGRY